MRLIPVMLAQEAAPASAVARPSQRPFRGLQTERSLFQRRAPLMSLGKPPTLLLL